MLCCGSGPLPVTQRWAEASCKFFCFAIGIVFTNYLHFHPTYRRSWDISTGWGNKQSKLLQGCPWTKHYTGMTFVNFDHPSFPCKCQYISFPVCLTAPLRSHRKRSGLGRSCRVALRINSDGEKHATVTVLLCVCSRLRTMLLHVYPFAAMRCRCLSFLIAVGPLAALEVSRSGSCTSSEVPWPATGGGVSCEAFQDAKTRATKFLNDNMPPWDVINRGTLQLGILPQTVQQALEVRQNFSWAGKVPEDVWMDYVLPYANVNEARSDWRPLLFEKLAMSPTPTKTLAEVAVFVNQHIWSELNPSKPVYFKPQQTPLIYDPMSAISFGFASCTGLSILYVDALRSVGVPARLVGTPAWHGKFEDGNHNWVASWKLFFFGENIP